MAYKPHLINTRVHKAIQYTLCALYQLWLLYSYTHILAIQYLTLITHTNTDNTY